MITELFQPDLLLVKNNGNVKDISDFFTFLFNRQESFGKPFVDSKYNGLYTPDRNSGSLKTRSFPMNGNSWAEFQYFYDNAYGIVLPVTTIVNTFSSGGVSLTDALVFLDKMGIYRNISFGTQITASDGHVIATGLNTPLQFEVAYNTLYIPYERSIKSAVALSLRYIKNLNQFGDSPGAANVYYRTSTLKFDGTGI